MNEIKSEIIETSSTEAYTEEPFLYAAFSASAVHLRCNNVGTRYPDKLLFS